MNPQEMLALLDSLDLDEAIVNKQLNNILNRNSFSEKHLRNVIRFLKYKLAVNKQEGIGCKNEKEYDFVGKLLADISEDSIEAVCEITLLVLQLDPKTVVGKSEHLLQQLLNDIVLPQQLNVTLQSEGSKCERYISTQLYLKLCGSILKAVLDCKQTVSLPFLDTPLERIIFSSDEKLLNTFFINTVPHFVDAVNGYNILDRIWNCLMAANGCRDVTLRALSCLSDYYLPIFELQEKQHYESNVVTYPEFWEVVLLGLQAPDFGIRKLAIYLIKRALDNLTGSDISININTKSIVMVWDKKNEKMLQHMWDNFFILIDSLEEMQSNIVLPSLKLFESVKHLGHCWLSCAYSIGLKHDNALVRLNCIKYRLEIKVDNKPEAITLLNALNDINLYENAVDSSALKRIIAKALLDTESFVNIIGAIALINWCPVPLYHLTSVLADITTIPLLNIAGHAQVCQNVNDILNIPCNIPIIRKGLFANMSLFIVNTCKDFTWEDYSSVYPHLHTETDLTGNVNLLTHLKKNLYLSEIDKIRFVETMTNCVENIDIGLLYVSGHEEEGIEYFKGVIKEKINKIKHNTQMYLDQLLYLPDVNFLTHLYSKTLTRSEQYLVTINSAVAKEYASILRYAACLLCSNVTLEVEDILILFQGLHYFKKPTDDIRDILVHVNKASCLTLKDPEARLDKKTYAVSIINYLFKNPFIIQHYQHEMFTLGEFLDAFKQIGKEMKTQGSGKLRSFFYEKSCEIVCFLLDGSTSELKKVLEYVENVLDCGGHDCLKYIIRMVVKILPMVLEEDDQTFDVANFLNQTWKAMSELKFNKEYVLCVEEFVKLIAEDALLRRPVYNNLAIVYYGVILQMAITRKTPLYFLVKQMTMKDVLVYENTVIILCSILLFAVVPKKDQRITENLSVELLSRMQGTDRQEVNIFNQHIHFLSVAVLFKVSDAKRLDEITHYMTIAVDDLLQIKYRYHGNSLTHRKIFKALQHILFILLKCRQVDIEKTAMWCMSLLKNVSSHERNIKICLEWYLALYIYVKDICVNSDLVHFLKSNGVPLTSQFYVLYFVTRHKISSRTHYAEETEFVVDFLFSHTMGPLFNVRLLAQYMLTQLFEANYVKKKINLDKYADMMTVVDKTLSDLSNAKDNSYLSITKDYFLVSFDIVSDLTPMFIYHALQRYCKQECNENIDTQFTIRILDDIDRAISDDINDVFIAEWKATRKWHAVIHYQGPTLEESECFDEAAFIQKKYIPWRNMSDVDANRMRKKAKNNSELIIVASLVDKLPNLGGLSRTSEVLGVQTFVIDSLRHLQDKQFQSLSVSAERWLNVEEVRPGRQLKEYLLRKQQEGYAIVAAEQTSNSCSIQNFKFPKKTLVLLGHEKEGIPYNLLPYMDHCVEIPQRGVIRSLNVHVTASIFIWEYTRQNIYGSLS